MQTPSPFDLDQTALYASWRAAKLRQQPAQWQDLVVDVRDPRRLTGAERAALLQLVARCNMAIYRSPVTDEDPTLPHVLARQLGMLRLDTNWLADEDGVSRIAVSKQQGPRTDFIPYTDRPIKWHTDGYYHPSERRICGMVLHCVRRAAEGGVNGLVDHERLYIALRDVQPQWIAALMQPDAMTIPERCDEQGVARAAQTGPVFSVLRDAGQGAALHMRYTARTRSIAWKQDAATRDAAAAIESLLAQEPEWLYRARLEPGMGLLCNNVLHDRSGFRDDPQQPRMLYRARYRDRISSPAQDGVRELPQTLECSA